MTKYEKIREWAKIVEAQEARDKGLLPSSENDTTEDYYQLCEGIDIDRENHVVSYNQSHENHVDTSLDGNPTEDTTLIRGIPVWSIFKRQEDNSGADGNPLVYALKGENEWKFRSPKDKDAILAQFNSIAEKFLQSRSYDVTLIVPSSNLLNNFIAETVVERAKDNGNNIEIIKGPICKLSTDDVYEMANKLDSTFHKTYRGKDQFEFALKQLEEYLKKMDDTRGGKFTRHLVVDQKMRNAIDRTLKLSDEYIAEFANKINGSDVLVIDDVISRGQSIKEMVKLISNTYAPKSITVLTLLSRRPESKPRPRRNRHGKRPPNKHRP